MLAALTASLLLTCRRLPTPGARLDLPWWVLLAVFFLAECVVVHIHFRRQTHTVSLSELPLVLALFAATPAGLIGAQVLGMGAALVFYRRQRPLKIAFNLAQAAFSSTLAIIVFRSLVGGRNPFGPAGWVAALVAAATAAAMGVILVSAAMTLAERRLAYDWAVGTAAVSFLGALTATSLALVAATLAHARPDALILLLLPAAVCVLAGRNYAMQRGRHDHVQSLFDSIHGTDEAELDSALRQLLLAARRLLRADYAEILVLPRDPHEQPLRSSIGRQGEVVMKPTEISAADQVALEAVAAEGRPLVRGRGKRLAALDAFAAERGLKDVIVATLDGETGVLGLLSVGDRADEVSTFGHEDEKLFHTFAGHAGLLLENEQLEQSLAKLTDVEAKLRHQALHDALTGLPNRRLFRARVDETLRRAAAEGYEPVVLFLDLDGFKSVNDDLGHAAGDDLLVAFAERLRRSVRPEELPARLGGDEFAVLIESGGREVAEDVAERLVDAVRSPFSIQGRRLSIQLSIGIAASSSADGAEELLANADLAMYAAKADDSSSYAIYAERMRGSAQARKELGEELEEALERDQISVHYQPIVDLRTGATIAFEALARWRRGSTDTVAAADFLPAAVERELIERIGRVVLRAACVQTQEWRVESDPRRELSVCVNLSPAEFSNPRLCVDVASALLETGLDASRLILEITEQVATDDTGSTLRTMSELRRLGVRFALDDFGTGHTSLEQLCRLPFDVVKIARPLVSRIGTGQGDERVTQAIVGLAQSLGLKVVAEGIESREQAERLKQLGCHLGQGFYFDRALAVAQATRRLRTTPAGHLRLVAGDSA